MSAAVMNTASGPSEAPQPAGPGAVPLAAYPSPTTSDSDN
jgi:hypothetical protein